MDFSGFFTLGFALVLGALIGSFTNVLIYRMPRGQSIAFPPSRCPNCDHRLGVLDLVPVLSWLSLGGKCRYCRNPINPRYPIIETISALAYAAIAYRFPLEISPIATIALWLLFTMLLAGAAIDIETFTLPDPLTLGAVALGIVAAALGATGPGLPNLKGATEGALIGAGILALIRGLGNWVLRRFREPQFPVYPIDDMHIHLATLAGFWFGPIVGVVVALVSVGINLISKKIIPIPDVVTLGGFFLGTIFLAATNIGQLGPNLLNAIMAAGAVALMGGLYWAMTQSDEVATEANKDNEENFDPQAMGFGDVKLLAAVGAFFGWQGAIFALVISVFVGAIVGVVGRLLGGDNKIPFGPYIVVGALAALFTGSAPLLDYLKNLGI